MKYYRCIADTRYLVKNELFTHKELEKKGINQSAIDRLFKELELKKSEVYWTFGCRFEVGTTPYTD